MEKTYFIYGKHSVFSAIETTPEKITSIFIGDEKYILPKITNTANYSIKKMDRNFFEKKFPHSNHQNIAAEVKIVEIEPIDKFLNQEKSTILVLDQITDPHNFGAIVRSAAAFGVDCIVSPQKNSVSDLAIIAKTSAGTSSRMPIYYQNLASFIDLAKKYGFWSYALDAEAEKTIYQEKFPAKTIIIMGSEGKGLRRLVMENADIALKIPMAEKIESLNVSCACSIVLAQIFNRTIK
jgi:23S rRNA (guanosine2251-2'-O)-methyltransferase